MPLVIRAVRRVAAVPLLLAVCCAAAFAAQAAAAASADASSPIEGVWSFNGGSVAIQREPGGFRGTVLTATQFAECPHQPGEVMWTDMVEQPDGSFWGLHQWFFLDSGCKPNPTLGPSAWRVLPAGTGHYLRVCLSEPDEHGTQPTIADDGTPVDASFGCVDSASIGPLPENRTSEFLESGASACLTANKLRVRIRVPKTNPLKEIKIALKGGGIKRVVRVKPRPKTFVAVLKLGRITAPTVRATVRLTTVLGAHLHRRHTYRRC